MGNYIDLTCCIPCISTQKFTDSFNSDSFDSQIHPPEFYQFSLKSTGNPSFLTDTNSRFNFYTDENRSFQCSAILGPCSSSRIPPIPVSDPL